MTADFPMFALSEEHQAIREAVRAVCDAKVAPYAAAVDEEVRYPQEAADALQAADDEQRQQDAIAYVDDALAAHDVYTSGTPDEVFAERTADYALITMGSVLLVPHLMVLFLLGILAVRLGRLTRPGRHLALWRRVRTLGLALGVRRTSVTASAGHLQDMGLITFRRGTVFIRDRAGLQAAACECYAALQKAEQRHSAAVAPSSTTDQHGTLCFPPANNFVSSA